MTELSHAEQNARDVVDRVSIADLAGVDRTGATDMSAAILEAINNRPAGATLRFPTGTYLVDGTMDATLTSPLKIEMEPGAKIKGTDSGSTIIFIRGGTGRYAFSIEGGQIDNSLRTFGVAEASGTCLSVRDVDDFKSTGVTYGNRDIGHAAQVGDSGISCTRCNNVIIDGNWFYGQPDAGLYPSGRASTDAHADAAAALTVTNNVFYRCWTGVSMKRDLGSFNISGNVFIQCRNNVNLLEADSGSSFVGPSHTGVISNNVFRKPAQAVVRIHGSDGGVVVQGNVIEDGGFQYDGTEEAFRCFWLRGARNCIISNNIIRYFDSTPASNSYPVYIENYVPSGSPSTTYTAGDNIIIGNSYLGIAAPELEETDVDPNFFYNNSYSERGVNIAGNAAPESYRTSYDSRATDGSGAGLRTFYGELEILRLFEENVYVNRLRFVDSLTNTRFADVTRYKDTLDFPSVAAGGRQSLTITQTGITSDWCAVVNPTSTTAVAGIVYTARCSTDSIIVTAHNYSSGAIDPPAGQFLIVSTLTDS